MVKNEFSIKDLENLSDVKAHTIRIWEKRYNLLEPNRTDTNIRRYDMENLKKLLNITYLYRAGHKISKLAEMTPLQIQSLIKKDAETHNSDFAIEKFKTAMLELDAEKFDLILENLLKTNSFSEIYSEVFVPLLSNAGILWHSGTVDPSHEHFISEKIKHQIILQIANSKKQLLEPKTTEFVLYLPTEEIHEICLLYTNYELVSNGFSTLYLGPNIPIESLKHVKKQKPNSIFVSCFTVNPNLENLKSYIDNFQEKVGTKNELWILGKRSFKHENSKNAINAIKFFEEINSFKEHLQKKS